MTDDLLSRLREAKEGSRELDAHVVTEALRRTIREAVRDGRLVGEGGIWLVTDPELLMALKGSCDPHVTMFGLRVVVTPEPSITALDKKD